MAPTSDVPVVLCAGCGHEVPFTADRCRQCRTSVSDSIDYWAHMQAGGRPAVTVRLRGGLFIALLVSLFLWFCIYMGWKLWGPQV
jgi:hypothetical protein